MPHLLQINYRFSVSRAEFESGFDAIASEIARCRDFVGKFGFWIRRNLVAGASTCSTMKSRSAHTSKVRSSPR